MQTPAASRAHELPEQLELSHAPVRMTQQAQCYPRDMQTQIHTKICLRIFMAALFTMAQTWQ